MPDVNQPLVSPAAKSCTSPGHRRKNGLSITGSPSYYHISVLYPADIKAGDIACGINPSIPSSVIRNDEGGDVEAEIRQPEKNVLPA